MTGVQTCALPICLGVSPWDVLHLGISVQTGISLGRVLQIVGVAVVFVSWLFHVKPSFVTLVNMFFVGFFIDLIMKLNYLPAPIGTLWQFASYLFGVAVCGIGTAIYISGNGGAGPRDSLMLALVKLTSWRVGVVRTIMEATVATLGYILGGPLGIGTILFALLVGVFVELGFAGIKRLKQIRFFNTLWFESVDLSGSSTSQQGSA